MAATVPSHTAVVICRNRFVMLSPAAYTPWILVDISFPTMISPHLFKSTLHSKKLRIGQVCDKNKCTTGFEIILFTGTQIFNINTFKVFTTMESRYSRLHDNWLPVTCCHFAFRSTRTTTCRLCFNACTVCGLNF